MKPTVPQQIQSRENLSSTNTSKCSETVCVGPHPSKECWSKPENFEKRERFLARRQNQSSAISSYPASQPKTQISGIKKVSRPSANAASSDSHLSFHTSYKEIDQEASAVTSEDGKWALHDTSATHHIFKDRKYFLDSSFVSSETPNKQLKLAGGGVSSNVKGHSTVKLKAGNGTAFELTNCLWVPEISRDMVAGGLLKKKGVREIFDDKDPTSFALVRGTVAIFNGYIGQDNLMNLEISPVSASSTSANSYFADVSSTLLHRRLGHLSYNYMKTMCDHESFNEHVEMEGLKGN